MNTAVIFDLEGALSDCRHRLKYLKEKDYKQWNELFYLDPPNRKVMNIAERESKKHKIIISTAKSAEYRDCVEKWISDNCNFEVEKIFFRDIRDDKKRSIEIKEAHLFTATVKYNIILAVDDREDNLNMYESYGIDTLNSTLFWEAENTPTTSDILRNAAELFKEKEKEYGTAYKRHGKIMNAFFPGGVVLKTKDDFYFWHIFELVVIKLNRVASAVSKGEQHKDSWNDMMVYAAMSVEKIKEEK